MKFCISNTTLINVHGLYKGKYNKAPGKTTEEGEEFHYFSRNRDAQEFPQPQDV